MTQQLSELRTRDIMVCLDRALRCSDELLALLNDEFEAVRRVDMEALVPMSRRKTEHLARLRMLDETLTSKVDAALAGEEMNGARQNPTVTGSRERVINLSALLPLVSDEFRAEIAGARELLGDKRRAIVAKNDFNRRLVKDSLLFVTDATRLITGALGRSGYRADGSASSRFDGPSFVSRAV